MQIILYIYSSAHSHAKRMGNEGRNMPETPHNHSMNHRIIEWSAVEKDLKDHLVSTPLPWTGQPTTRPGCPVPHHLLLF